MVDTQVLSDPEMTARIRRAFGSERDSMEEIASRAEQLFPDHRLIVWEGDAQTFEFAYVSEAAGDMLGYPVERWTSEPAFWAETVVHPDDRSDAIAFCALATGKCADHDFVYRATTADGRTVWLHDIVTVIRGNRGVASKLRGIMIDVSEERSTS